MPKQIPRYDLELSEHADAAREMVLAGEKARVIMGSDWTIKRLEFLYELAYLRVFIAWEQVLESIFYRSLCGYASSSGLEDLVCGKYYSKIAEAETAVLASENKTYLLWHNPWNVMTRLRKHIGPLPPSNPPTPALQEHAIASNSARLAAFSAVRHRIVHEQKDGKTKFDDATLLFSGKTYPASRPGKFLRDTDTNSIPHRKWIETAIAELTGLAGQMV